MHDPKPTPSTTAVRTRVLAAGDLDLLRELIAVFAEAFEDAPTYLGAPPDDAWLNGVPASDTFIAVAAVLDGRVVGGLAGYVLPKFEQRRREFYLYDLGVLADFRRRGIATAVIGHLPRETAARGIGVVLVQADLEDAPAVALYSRPGVRADVLHFDLNLPADGLPAPALNRR